MTNLKPTSLLTFPAGEQTLLIPGGAGDIELITQAPRQLRALTAETPPTLAIICHPHSLMGGTMNNKVVHTVAKLLRDQGLYTIRFNFRGVGNSTGVFDKGVTESEDVMTIVEWAQTLLPADLQIYLVGFSFGAYVSLRAANQLLAKGYPVKQLVSIAPPAGHFPLEQESRPACS